jgi:hypothetical protein
MAARRQPGAAGLADERVIADFAGGTRRARCRDMDATLWTAARPPSPLTGFLEILTTLLCGAFFLLLTTLMLIAIPSCLFLIGGELAYDLTHAGLVVVSTFAGVALGLLMPQVWRSLRRSSPLT